MQSIIHSRIAAIGVAALLSTSYLVAADAPFALSSTWDGGTTSKSGDDVQIKLSGKLQAAIFGYDVDKKLTQTHAQGKAGLGFGDGVGLEDAEIHFTGSAYTHVTFGLRLDVSNSKNINPAVVDKNFMKVDRWWVGLTAVPYIGEITMREIHEHAGFIVTETWIEEPVVHNFFASNGGFPTMVGVKWAQTVKNTGIPILDDRLSVWAATGLVANEIGTTNKDWSLNGSVCWQVVKENDNLNAYAKFDVSRQNMAGTTTGKETWSQKANMYAGQTSAPLMGTFTSDPADSVMSYIPSAAVTYRNIGCNAQYYLAQGDAATTGRDFTVSGWTIAAAVALTGENETNTLGIKKPKKALKGDNLLENFGALELVARVSMLDASDKDYKDKMDESHNLVAGADVTEYQVGLNWYPTGNMLVGLMYSLDQFKANATGAEEYSASMFGVRTMVKF